MWAENEIHLRKHHEYLKQYTEPLDYTVIYIDKFKKDGI